MTDRMKSYDAPHKGIRNALSLFSISAGRTNYSDTEEVKELYLLGNDVFTILTIHAEDENQVPLAELEAKCPGCSNHDIADHEIIEIEQRKLERMLSKINADSGSGRNVNEAGSEFYLAFSEFHANYLEHMAEEERVTQLLLWKFFTDEELAGHRQKIMINLKPQTLLIWLRFILPAQTPLERAAFISGFKKSAPISLFQEGMEIIKGALTDQQFKSLQEGIGAV